MEVPKWFEDNYGPGNACSGWYMEINNGKYSLLPYDIHRKTQEEQKNTEQQQQQGQERRQQKQEGQNGSVIGDKASLPRLLFQKFFHKVQLER